MFPSQEKNQLVEWICLLSVSPVWNCFVVWFENSTVFLKRCDKKPFLFTYETIYSNIWCPQFVANKRCLYRLNLFICMPWPCSSIKHVNSTSHRLSVKQEGKMYQSGSLWYQMELIKESADNYKQKLRT